MSTLINGRTPAEIKDGLRIHSTWGQCECCSYNKEKGAGAGHCIDRLTKDVYALIEHIEAERDAALAKVPKWISVAEQPEPPQDGEYWCFGYWISSGRGQVEIADYIGEWKITNNFVLTHWMLLPEPPEEGE